MERLTRIGGPPAGGCEDCASVGPRVDAQGVRQPAVQGTAQPQRPAADLAIDDVTFNGQSMIDGNPTIAAGDEVEIEVTVRDRTGGSGFVTAFAIVQAESLPVGGEFNQKGWVLFNCTAMQAGGTATIDGSTVGSVNNKPISDGTFTMPEQAENVSIKVGGIPEDRLRDRGCAGARFESPTDQASTTVTLPDVGRTGVVPSLCSTPDAVAIPNQVSVGTTVLNDTIFNQSVDIVFLAGGSVFRTVPNLTLAAGEEVILNPVWDSGGEGAQNRTLEPGTYDVTVRVNAETGEETAACGEMRVIGGGELPDVETSNCTVEAQPSSGGVAPPNADLAFSLSVRNVEDLPIDVRVDWVSDPPGIVAGTEVQRLDPGEAATFEDTVTGELPVGNFEFAPAVERRFITL